MSFLFGGDEATSEQKSTVPGYIKDTSRDAISKASSIAEQPYQRYEGPRVAEMSQAEKEGYNAARVAGKSVKPGGAAMKRINRARTDMNQAGDDAGNIMSEARPQFSRSDDALSGAFTSSGNIMSEAQPQFARSYDALGNARGTAQDIRGAAQPQFARSDYALGGALGTAQDIQDVAQPQFNRASGTFDQARGSAGDIYSVARRQFGSAASGYRGADDTAVDTTRAAEPLYEMQAPTLQEAKGTASSVAGRSFPDHADRYMNPFVSGALAPALDDLRIQSARLQQQGDAEAARQGGRGAFGSARAGIEAAERQERTQEEMSAMLSEGYRQAYDRAQQAFAEDERRRLSASQQMGALAGTSADIYSEELGRRLEGAGLRADIASGQTQLGATKSEAQAARAREQRAIADALSRDATRRAEVAAQQAQAERTIGEAASQAGAREADVVAQQAQAQTAIGEAASRAGAREADVMAQQARAQTAVGEAASQAGAREADAMAQQAAERRRNAGALADMTALQEQTRIRGAQAATSVGQLPRQIEQQSLDTAYNDFLEQRDWNQRGLDSYLRALRGTPYEQTQQTVTEPSTGQTIGQLSGAAIAGIGAYNTFF